ncbi:helix-turn-helix domain-containing protein [Flammeovirga kamogawensis]|uniref:Helix-turn-helix transcriptional regulator n=1 Tax=Flammeovirga kamogawensis TaxID=373891 RepID=A0ABX8H611_9BACT|nr:AraC family transcriptional regulator [Flammeovirga kamogawensis]MBB6463852.1 AraC-like DNA-binding protein [Flammeovirga kamogawensis]QWG10777.1 helix-turn-helix transcriptional regulator [Flammeovirga kamogawensis]TRX63237.1 helix-turn-helix transcriptional regulator [Flammeovirga kamogawensis]
MPNTTLSATIKFTDVKTSNNYKYLADQYNGTWDGETLNVDNEVLKLHLKLFSFFDVISVELCEATTFQPITFIQMPKSDINYIYIRIGFSGSILNIKNANEFNSSGIFIYNSNQHFEIEYPKGINNRWIVIKFPQDLYYKFVTRKDFKLSQLIEDPNPWIHYLPLNSEIEGYIKTIFNHGFSEQGRKIIPFSKSLDIISVITEQLEAENPSNIQKKIHSIDLKVILSIKDQILSNIDSLPRLDDLSIEYGMSISKIHRLFKYVYKMPVLKFYNLQKVEMVRQKVQHSDESLTNIAADLGFSHVAHMSRVFKQHFGYPPSSLRKIQAYK